MTGHVAVVGVGLIGGSLARALAAAGHEVVGYDADSQRLATAADAGLIARAAASIAEAVADARAAFVAVPVSSVPAVVAEALDAGVAAVTDVGSVKASVVRAVEELRPETAARFVGGHPMAGSEQDGLEGADPDLFRGATWVLTPTSTTDPQVFTGVRALLRDVGAEVVAVEPEQHDALVAVVSHVPHLAAGTRMLLAAQDTPAGPSGELEDLLHRLEAGGFRDMTRIAAGHPGIWPDICAENREAIVAALDWFLAALQDMRSAVVEGDRPRLLSFLERARHARTNLPITGSTVGPFVELRIPVPDRPGVLAEVTTLAGQLGVNIVDLEIAHSVEGPGGVLVMVIPQAGAEPLESGLDRLGYHWARRPLE